MVVALATILSAGAGAAQAFTGVAVPCTERSTTQVFAAWGDTNDYFPMTGGTFESAASWFLSDLKLAKLPPKDPGWKLGLGNALVVARTRDLPTSAFVPSGAPPVGVPGYRSGNAMQVRTTDLTTSSTVCIRPNEPSVRFFYRDSGIAGSHLEVTVYQIVHADHPVLNGPGVLQTNTLRIPAVPGPPTWRLSPVVQTSATYSRATADLLVTFRGFGGDFLVDNLYVDPFRSR